MAQLALSFIDPLWGMGGRGGKRGGGGMFREAPDGLIPLSDREPP